MTVKVVGNNEKRLPLWSIRDLSDLLGVEYKSLYSSYAQCESKKPMPIIKGHHIKKGKQIHDTYFIKEEFLELWNNRK